jgi:hypothetical protein
VQAPRALAGFSRGSYLELLAKGPLPNLRAMAKELRVGCRCLFHSTM